MCKKTMMTSRFGLLLIAAMLLLKPCVGGSPLKEIRDDERITYYYRDPQPAALIPVLESVLKQRELTSNSKYVASLAHFFATAILKDANKLEEFKALEPIYAGDAKGLIKRIIKETDKYRAVILKSPEDLELLWSEYKVGGDRQIIERIIKALSASEESNPGLGDSAMKFLIEKAPSHVEIYDLLVRKSNSSLGREKELIDEMISIVDRVALNPAEDHLDRGLNYKNLKRYSEALEEYKKGLNCFPDDSRIYHSIAVLYHHKGELQEAIKIAQKGLSIHPDDAKSIFNLGLYHYSLREYDESMKWYLRALEFDPDDPNCHHQLAILYRQKKDTEKGVFHYKEYVKHAPNGIHVPWIKEYLTSIGKPIEEDQENLTVVLQGKRYDALEDRLLTLLNGKGRDKEGRSLLSEAYKSLCTFPPAERRYETRIDELKGWLAQYDSSHFANACLGMVYLYYSWDARGTGWGRTVTEEGSRLFKERLLTARDYLERAYSLNPSDPIVPARLINVAMGLGLEREEIEKQFKRAVLADPADDAAYSAKLSYLMPKWQGSEEEMFSFAREAARNAPLNSMIPSILATAHWEKYTRSNSNSAYFRDPGVWQEMKAVYSTLSKSFPESKAIHNFFAKAAYLARDFKVAREELNRVENDWSRGAWGDKKNYEEVKKELSEPGGK